MARSTIKWILEMIGLCYAPSPNGRKITLFPEETQLQYRLTHINVSKDNQFRPDFLLISPNNKIPAVIDHAPEDGGRPINLFESGEVLLYLVGKNGRLLSGELHERHATLQWLFRQVSGLDPMLGQNHHFSHYTLQTVPCTTKRYQVRAQHLYDVMSKCLETSPWLRGNHYSIAGIICWPRIYAHQRQHIDPDNYPVVNNWHEHIRARSAAECVIQQAPSEKR